MFTNAERALIAESTFVLHEFLGGAWRTQLPPVTELLRWPDLKILVKPTIAPHALLKTLGANFRLLNGNPKLSGRFQYEDDARRSVRGFWMWRTNG
jgi:hypothetical protein